MKFKLGFQKQLSIGFTIITIISMVTCAVFSYVFISNIIQKLTIAGLTTELNSIRTSIEVSSKDNLTRVTKLMDFWGPKIVDRISVSKTEQFQQVMINKFTNEKKTVSLPETYFDKDSIKGHGSVDQISSETAGISSIFLRFKDGFVGASTSIKNEDGSRATGTYLPLDAPPVKTLLEGKRFVGQARILGSNYYVAYEPIKKDGEVVGAFFLGAKDNSEDELKSFLKKQKLLETGYFYILDSAGKFIMHPSKEGENVLASTDLDGKPIFKEIIDKKNGMIEYRWLNHETKQAQDKIALFQYFPEQDWYVSASLNVAEVQAPTRELRWTLFMISSLMTVLMMLATVLFGRYVAKRLGRVNGTLSESSQQVEESGSKLYGLSELLASSSTQQAASLQQTVSAITEINAMIDKNVEATKLVEDLFSEMDRSAKAGYEILTELKGAIQNISKANSDLGTEVKDGYKEIGKIIEVIQTIEERTKVIHDIVFQTKLLSFNASVEAARAGENGKGFAVVAEEVGRLAEMSGKAASEIQTNLQESRQQVEDIINKTQGKMSDLTQAADNQSKNGVEISEKCQSVFDVLIEKISNSYGSIQNISQASLEQSKGIGEIDRAAIELDKVTQENSNSAQQVRSLAETLNKDAKDMKDSVHELTVFLHGGNSKLADVEVSAAPEEYTELSLKKAA